MTDERFQAPMRLRPLVEVLSSGDGDLYLLQGPGASDFVIREPSAEVRAIVSELRRGGSVAAIAERCATSAVAVEEVTGVLRSSDMLEPVEPRPQLEPEDAQRFDRQLLYLRQRAVHPETGPALQRRLRAARVVVLGCGGLGTWTAWSLATIGVGELVLVDPDTVDLSNLNRQILFDVDDIGRGKAVVASRRLKAFDPRLVARAVTDSVEGPRDVAALARGADLVVACADSPAYDIGRWINDGCNDAGVPHISAGQMPPIARVGPFVVPGETACVRCLELSVRRDNRLAGELEAKRKPDPPPSATLGPVCGLIAAMIGVDALHWLTGLGRPASWGTALTIDIRTLTVGREPVAPHPECGCCAQPK